jgi:hypothetical protein
LQHEEKEKGHEELPEQLLLGGQPQVAPHDHLDEVVHKAHGAKAQTYQEQHFQFPRWVGKLPHRQGESKQNDRAAHRRRARFLAVALGPFLANALAKLQAAQQGNEQGTEQYRDEKSSDQGEQQDPCVHL